jgi:hypothetical protein
MGEPSVFRLVDLEEMKRWHFYWDESDMVRNYEAQERRSKQKQDGDLS